jgi:hypothetical protein
MSDEFEFTENSKAMYEGVTTAPPWFVRFLVKNKVDNALKARGCGKVTEQIIYDVCKEVTPSNMLDRTIEVCDKHRTNMDAK